MRKILFLALLACAVTAGCKLSDENPNWNPKQDYAEWTYDAPFYYRPTTELKPLETIGKNTPVYYISSTWFFVSHPGNCQLVGDPRVAVWYSTDEGQNWQRAGFYGVEQSHFLFEAKEDGNYWIRFVGPGQKTAKGPVPQPHRIYVVDTQSPLLAIAIKPSPWQDEEKKVPTVYSVGQEIVVGWQVEDPNLKINSIKMESCVGKAPYEVYWMAFRDSLPPEGNRKVVIPSEAARYGNFRFRLEAEDKAGNIAVATTVPLFIKPSDVAAAKTTTQPADGLIPVEEKSIIKRPGWPDAGQVFRGDTKQIVSWMPEFAANYSNIKLELSINNALTWATLADGLSYGDVVEWTVPTITSRFCMVRLVAIDTSGDLVLLARSAQFRITTPTDRSEIGPEVIPEPQPGEESEKPANAVEDTGKSGDAVTVE